MLSFLRFNAIGFACATLALTTLAGCLRCEEEIFHISFILTAEDADTGEPVCDAVVRAAQDDQLHQVTASSCSYFGPNEVEGRFAITVEHPDYDPVQLFIKVEPEDHCHVRTETQHLVLSPVSNSS